MSLSRKRIKRPANRSNAKAIRATPRSKASKTQKKAPSSRSVRMRSNRESWHHVVREEWGTLVQQIKNQRLLRTNKTDTPVNERMDNYWKREIYRLVCFRLDDSTGKYLDDILNEISTTYRGPLFKDNPFQLALHSTMDESREKDERWKPSRYSKQLVYARRHRVPAELLIGFLHQAGTPDEVCSKANDPETFEPWRAEFLARLKDPGGTPG